MKNNIELELRAEVSPKKFDDLLRTLHKKTQLISKNKRLSAMFLGKINKNSFDIRTRIDSDGKAEIVIKKGNFHTHDRTETSQNITKDQFLGFVKLLSVFGFKSKITERENFVFDLGNKINLILVKAGNIAYVEIEKISNMNNKDSNKDRLLRIISDLNLKLIKNSEEFNNLCDRLTKLSDWSFNDSGRHIKRLTSMLMMY